MGGLSSVATTAIHALGAANAVLGTVQNYQDRSGGRDYDNLKKQNALVLQNAAEQAALQKEQIRLNAETAETERRAALRRAIAKQRARFGASGTGSNGGSAQAVLLGLFDESEEELAQRNSLDALRTRAIDQNFAGQQRINTLQLTQLKERDRLSNLSAKIGGLQDIGSIIMR